MKRSNILVPVSINQLDIAKKALDEARAMVAEDGIITVLYSREPITGPAKHYLEEGMIKARDNDIMKLLQSFVGDDKRCKIKVAAGRAGLTIVEYAHKHACECIIISSHRPDLSDYLLGSTASRVVRHARCSVLVLR